MRALVTGGSGCLGRALVNRLVRAGEFCRVLDVEGPAGGSLPRGVEYVPGDVRALEQVRRAVQNIDVVFHFAAVVHGRGDEESVHAVNVGGTANVVQAAAECGVLRMVFASTIGVYGVEVGQNIREDQPEDPKTLYARSKQQAERLVLGARGVEGVVLRFPVAYGPFDRGNVSRLIRAIDRKRFVQFGNGRHVRAMISSQRAAEAAMLAAQSPAVSRQAIQAADLPHPSLKGLIDAIRKALGLSGAALRLPCWVGRSAARCCDGLSAVMGTSGPFSTSVFNKLFCPLSLDCRKAADLLGLGAGCDLAKGVSDEVAWLRGTGRLGTRARNEA